MLSIGTNVHLIRSIALFGTIKGANTTKTNKLLISRNFFLLDNIIRSKYIGTTATKLPLERVCKKGWIIKIQRKAQAYFQMPVLLYKKIPKLKANNSTR